MGSDRRGAPRELIAGWPALRQLTAAPGLLAGGSAATRFGVFRAGPASVAGPKYVVAAQRPGGRG